MKNNFTNSIHPQKKIKFKLSGQNIYEELHGIDSYGATRWHCLAKSLLEILLEKRELEELWYIWPLRQVTAAWYIICTSGKLNTSIQTFFQQYLFNISEIFMYKYKKTIYNSSQLNVFEEGIGMLIDWVLYKLIIKYGLLKKAIKMLIPTPPIH